MKKPLPDHRPKVRSDQYHHPTKDEVKKLAGDYGFAADFDLAGRLERVYSGEDTARCIDEDTPTPGEQRELLEALRDRCHAVKEAVSKLGSNEIRRLDSVFSELDRFRQDAHRLHRASIVALVSIEKGKRQKQDNIWNFVNHLADVWQDGTGKLPKCGYDDIRGQYVGDFYNFVIQCASLGNIQISQGEPGGTIMNILKEWRQRN